MRHDTSRSSGVVPRLSRADLDARYADLPTTTAPVLIVGGGLVGLATALLLTQHGVRPLLVERHATTALHPRARGFHAPTLELLAPSGVADVMMSSGLTASSRDVLGILTAVTLAGPVLDFRVEPTPATPTLSAYPVVAFGQDRLEPVIRDAAVRGGADVRFATALVAFADEPGDDGEVVAIVEDRRTGARTRVCAQHMVAADGARSPIREALGIARTGRGHLGHNVSTLVDVDLSALRREHPFVFAKIVHPEAGGVVVATDVPHRWIYATHYDPENVRDTDFTPEDWARRFRLAAGVPDLRVSADRTFTWEAAERVAERMSAGRVFLAGDAAHQMPPTGGWGANTGIQDAGNLAWKLAAVLRGDASPRLLDSYDAERRPVDAEIARQATLLALRMTGQPVADDELASDDAVVFGTRYASDTGEPIPRRLALDAAPGTRAPHVWLSRDGRLVSTVSLFGRGLVLLAGDAAWTPAAGVTVEVADGWQAAYGVDDDGAALIRPDGFVAARWRGLPAQPAAAVSAAIEALLCRAAGC